MNLRQVVADAGNKLATLKDSIAPKTEAKGKVALPGITGLADITIAKKLGTKVVSAGDEEKNLSLADKAVRVAGAVGALATAGMVASCKVKPPKDTFTIPATDNYQQAKDVTISLNEETLNEDASKTKHEPGKVQAEYAQDFRAKADAYAGDIAHLEEHITDLRVQKSTWDANNSSILKKNPFVSQINDAEEVQRWLQKENAAYELMLHIGLDDFCGSNAGDMTAALNSTAEALKADLANADKLNAFAQAAMNLQTERQEIANLYGDVSGWLTAYNHGLTEVQQELMTEQLLPLKQQINWDWTAKADAFDDSKQVVWGVFDKVLRATDANYNQIAIAFDESRPQAEAAKKGGAKLNECIQALKIAKEQVERRDTAIGRHKELEIELSVYNERVDQLTEQTAAQEDYVNDLKTGLNYAAALQNVEDAEEDYVVAKAKYDEAVEKYDDATDVYYHLTNLWNTYKNDPEGWYQYTLEHDEYENWSLMELDDARFSAQGTVDLRAQDKAEAYLELESAEAVKLDAELELAELDEILDVPQTKLETLQDQLAAAQADLTSCLNKLSSAEATVINAQLAAFDAKNTARNAILHENHGANVHLPVMNIEQIPANLLEFLQQGERPANHNYAWHEANPVGFDLDGKKALEDAVTPRQTKVTEIADECTAKAAAYSNAQKEGYKALAEKAGQPNLKAALFQ